MLLLFEYVAQTVGFVSFRLELCQGLHALFVVFEAVEHVDKVWILDALVYAFHEFLVVLPGFELSVDPEALLGLTVLCGVAAYTKLFTLDPVAIVLAPIRPDLPAPTVLLVAIEFANVFFAVWINHLSLAMHLIVHKLTSIPGLISIRENAMAMRIVVHEGTLVYCPI